MSVVRLIALVSSVLIAVACGGSGGGGGGGGADGGGTNPIGQPGQLIGEFLLSVFDAPDEDLGEFMRSSLQPRIDYVNRVADIPKDIPVDVVACGIQNAFYVLELEDVEEGQLNGPQIFMCWELYASMLLAYLEIFPEDEDAEFAVALSMGAYSQVLHHEIGHAFDDQLDLPIVGNTESAADAIATVLSVEQDAAVFVIAAALLFDTTGDGSFGAVHPGGADRAGDLFCWALGGDADMAEIFPEFVQIFVESGRDCVAEYAGQRSAVVSWLPGIADVALASNPDRSILSTDSLGKGSLESLRGAIANSRTMKDLIEAQ